MDSILGLWDNVERSTEHELCNLEDPSSPGLWHLKKARGCNVCHMATAVFNLPRLLVSFLLSLQYLELEPIVIEADGCHKAFHPRDLSGQKLVIGR